jgi:hypothetical protein
MTMPCPEVKARMTYIYFLSLLGDIDYHSFSLYYFLGRKLAFTSGLAFGFQPVLPANLRKMPGNTPE